MTEELERMRADIRNIDRDIITMIARRTELAKSIGKEKQRRGIPLRDWEVEKKVMENALAMIESTDFSQEFVRTLMQLLIQESRVQQEVRHFSRYKGEKEAILIIGGLGDMGKWFSGFFGNQGHDVRVYDPAGKSGDFKSITRLEDGLDEASFICIATSLESVPGVIDAISDMGFAGTVFDIASLKGHLKDSVDRARERGISITSIHPMFGPRTRTLSDKVICICDCGDEVANERVEGLFADTAASRVRLSFDEHDRAMSLVLGLAHFINILNAKVLSEGGYSYEELKKIGSTTFFSQMVTTESVIKENPDLYYAIQQCNPYKEELLAKLKKAMDDLGETVIEEDRKGFIDMINKGSEWIK